MASEDNALVKALRDVVERGYWIREGKGQPSEDWAIPLEVYMDVVLALSDARTGEPAENEAERPAQ